jgi:hypothetical protein
MAKQSVLPGADDTDNRPTGPSDSDAVNFSDEVDLSQGLRLNLSDQEASTRTFEDFVAGKYNTKITDVEVRYAGAESKNPGKPMLNFEFQVQDGKYEGQKMWTLACLWEGALYTIVNLHKALGLPVDGNSLQVLPPGDYVGRDVIVKMGKGKDSKEKNADGTPKYPARIEVKGFFRSGDTTVAAAQAGGGLLP